MKLSDDIRYVKGIGEKRAQLFEKMGVHTVQDLLYHLPRTYEDRSVIKNISDLLDGETVCVRGHLIQGVRSFRGAGGIRISQTAFSDGTGILKVTWFNSPYIQRSLFAGREYVIFGKAAFKANHFEMINPITEDEDKNSGKTGSVLPVYPLTAGLTQNTVREALKNVFSSLSERPKEIIPKKVLEKKGYMPIWEALSSIHFPKTPESFFEAEERLSFEEMLVMQTGIIKLKDVKKAYTAPPVRDVRCVKEFASSLPFELTNAQKKAINEICADLKRSTPMNRLVQGDVGSGKTIVAAAAVFAAVKSGYQSALMAPTEILAKQHYDTFSKVFDGFGINIVLLTGGQGAREKRESLEKISNGEAELVIGTHALISENAKFKALALAITDEQHRFGVRQRAFLNEKGVNAHTLVMTATPIPRTLTLILYGDLDVSVIDELPPGRKPVKTYAATEKMRKRVYEFVRKNINEGRQAYMICPLVEESEALNANSAVEYADKLRREVFPELEIAVLHGKLKPKEKDGIMERFKNGKINILVATTVVEVGVDVPNATVMVIENSERFGLSQLHQLRGRIGRGEYESFCILFLGSDGEIARERVRVMCETSDGFKISEYDLKLRGPGEVFGVRQHGLPELKISNLATDMELLKEAQEAAIELVGEDFDLESEDNSPLKAEVMRKFDSSGGRSMLN